MDSATQICMSKAFCRAAFENLHISIGGQAKPCCEFEGSIGSTRKNSIEEIWSSHEINDLRAKMLRGERDGGCRKCYNVEEAGGVSLREMFNGDELVADVPDAQSITPPSPKYLDIRFSNLCNLSCRTCGPDASTRWHADAKRLNFWDIGPSALVKTFGPKLPAIDALGRVLETVETIYFAGGEPLLHEEHYAVLLHLIACGRTDVCLCYNSNLTELRLGKFEILPLWAKFKNVSMHASIDGHKERGELIRAGLSWDRFAANAAAIKRECPHVDLRFAITVSIFNILSLPDLCQALMEIGVAGAKFSFNVLQEPEHFSIQILPDDMKHVAKSKIEAFADAFGLRADLGPVVNFMMFKDRSEKLGSFRRNAYVLDRLRNENTIDTIPELAPILREMPLQRHVRESVASLAGFVRSLRFRSQAR